MKTFWLNMQNDILHGKGYTKIWFVLLILAATIVRGSGRSSPFWYLCPMIVIAFGLFFVTAVLIAGRGERTSKDTKRLAVYFCVLLVITGFYLWRIITLW